ncbi:hypothetical protein HZ326_20137 [Fusarium oxysporum f. sp. albedinis]|nr:hypothetical protein HZ326_20137 [Fusarium oxysporum f. sp. albedinis]
MVRVRIGKSEDFLERKIKDRKERECDGGFSNYSKLSRAKFIVSRLYRVCGLKVLEEKLCDIRSFGFRLARYVVGQIAAYAKIQGSGSPEHISFH